MARHNQIGTIGENSAAKYCEMLGWTVLERNYRRNYGEIDIVARETGGVVVFVEVKTVSWETARGVPHETHRPEENIHPQKLKRLSRTIESFIASRHIAGDWRFDVMAVFLDPVTNRAMVRHTRDVIIGA